jgi:adenylate cyclase
MDLLKRMFHWIFRLTPARISLLIMVLFLFMYIQKERGRFDTAQLLEVKAYDLRFQALNGMAKVSDTFKPDKSDKIVIAIVDNRTLEFLNWPFPRERWAEFVRKIEQYEPAVVAFDVAWESPGSPETLQFAKELNDEYEKMGLDKSRGSAGEFTQFLKDQEVKANKDLVLAQELAKHDNIVEGYFGYISPDEAATFTPEDLTRQFGLVEPSAIKVNSRMQVEWPDIIRAMTGRQERFYGFRPPVEPLAHASKHFGYFTSIIDSIDGTIRSAPMVYAFTLDKTNPTDDNSYFFPALSMEALRVYLKSDTIAVDVAKINSHFLIQSIAFPEKNIKVPTDEYGRLLINWMGPAYNTYPSVPVYDILTDFKKMQLSAQERAQFDPVKTFKGKIVLVGSSATGAHDMRTTPFGTSPGVEMHANVISNILNGNALSTPEWFRFFDLLFIIGVGLLYGLVLPRVSAIWGGVLALLFTLGYFGFNIYLFLVPHLSFTIVFPLTEILFIYTGVTVYRYATEEREKRFIKHTFQHYLSPAVIEDLMKDPSKLKLGGEKREMTAFFSDIQSFSSFSENMTPERLVHFLNIYLTEICDIILRYDGTIDKFEGDAIIAFFGAPITLPDHAARAAECAAEIQQRMNVLRKEWMDAGWPEVHMRIGLNSGEIVVGNMGSRDRMDYTIMGNAVNLAARLESGAKQYRIYTMVSEFTRNLAGDVAEYRELDMIRVKGIETPVKVYEILGPKGQADPKKLEVARAFEEGLALYRDRYWAEALNKFLHCLDLDPHDGPSHVFTSRCEEFADHPPGDGWDGVYTMTSK